MFCLRNWIALLVFLTNASPIYVFLFLSATYAIQRPCVYCSILLFVLIFSLFDFDANWFEPRWKSHTSVTETASSLFSGGNAMVAQVLGETASTAISAVNATRGSLATAAMEGIKKTVVGETAETSAAGSGFEWLRSLLEKRQVRIPCVDVIVRL